MNIPMAGHRVLGDRAEGHDNHFNLLRMIAATGVLAALCVFLHVWPYGDSTYAHVGLPFAFGAALYLWRQVIPLSPLLLLVLAGAARYLVERPAQKLRSVTPIKRVAS